MKLKINQLSAVIKTLIWLLIVLIFSVAIGKIWAILPDNDSTGMLKVLQLLQTLILFVLPPYIIASLSTDTDTPEDYLYLKKPRSIKLIILCVAMTFTLVPVINCIHLWNQGLVLPEAFAELMRLMEEQEALANQLLERFLAVDSVGGLLLNVFIMALLPAVGEELTFRAMFIRFFNGERETISWLSICTSAFIFSFIHFQFFGFVPRFLLGVLFGVVLRLTRSIYFPMMMHFTNNAIATVVYFCLLRCGIDVHSADTFGTGETFWITLVSLALFIRLLLLFIKECKKNHTI